MHEVRIGRSATKELESLPDKVVQRIVAKIDALAQQPRPSGSKKLKGADDLWRIRGEVAPLGHVGHVGRLPLPLVPVERRRHGPWLKRPADIVFAKHYFHSLEFANPALPHHLHGRAKPMVAAMPGAHLHDPVRGGHRLADLLPLVDRERERLLAVDVLPRLDGVDEHLRMPVVGRADQDHADPLVVEESAVVDVAVGGGDAGVDLVGRHAGLPRHFRVDDREVEAGPIDVGDPHDPAMRAAGVEAVARAAVRRRRQPADGPARGRAFSRERPQATIASWVVELPKPVGILACTDQFGFWLFDAGRRAGVAVPEEVAVVAAENDETLCTVASPPLSSVVDLNLVSGRTYHDNGRYLGAWIRLLEEAARKPVAHAQR